MSEEPEEEEHYSIAMWGWEQFFSVVESFLIHTNRGIDLLLSILPSIEWKDLALFTAKRGVEYGVHRSPVYRSFLALHGLRTGV